MGKYIPEEGADLDGLPFLALAEPERLKRLDRLRGEFRHLNQRVHDREAFKRLPLVEQYARGGLAVICYLQGRGGLDTLNNALSGHSKTAIAHTVTIALIYRVNVINFGDEKNGNEQSVFVDVTEFLNGPNRRLPGIVRAYLVKDDRCQLGHGLLYNSIGLGSFYVVPFFAGRVIQPFGLIVEKFSKDVIKRRTETVDRIADDERRFGWESLNNSEAKDILSGIALSFAEQLPKVRLEEHIQGRFKLLDVAIGPFNL
jgi:hypothetical protein